MRRKAIGSVILFVLLGALAVGQAQQAQESYLDVFTVQVKPEKRADFDAIYKKIVAANRQNKGDTWLAMETTYGPGNRVAFLARHNRNHTILPSELNFRANIYGFKKLGVEWILSASAVGSLREELKPAGIRVTSIMPGATMTASWEGSGVPEERLMKASDVAATVYGAYLLSQHSVVEEIVVRPMLGDL